MAADERPDYEIRLEPIGGVEFFEAESGHHVPLQGTAVERGA
jgi:hypothetical protein